MCLRIFQSIRFVMESINGTKQPFSIDNAGEVKVERPLDFETEMTHQLIIWVTDGVTVIMTIAKMTCNT